METQNETSSLLALRELRASDQRRQREAEQARARQERLAREDAERQAAEAYERAQSTRLGRELEVARTEIARLRGELEQACLARSEVALPSVMNRARTFGWLGICAGATMLVGALALWAAMQPRARPPALAGMTTRPAPCPQQAPAASVAREPQPTPTVASAAPAPGKRTPKSRPPRPRRPPASHVPAVVCDGTDPLCGLPSGLSDDLGKPRGRRDR